MSAAQQGLVLHPNCVAGKVGINNKLFAHKEWRFKEMEVNQPKSIKLKMRGHKLISGVNWQGTLKKKRHNTNGDKTRLYGQHS
jgi:hypothetical protein